MGSNKTPDYLRGLLIPDPRFTFANMASTPSENTPRPGIPEAQQTSDVIFETSGTQADATDLRIYAQAPGFPEDKGGSFLWRNGVQDSGLKWHGWEPPHHIHGIEKVDAAQSGSEFYRNFDALTTNNDTLICAANETGTTGTPVSVWHKSTDAATWTQVQIAADTDLEPAHSIITADFPYAGPALCLLPSGRVLIFFWVHLGQTTDGTPEHRYQIRSHYSDDNGTTWHLGTEYALREAVESSVAVTASEARRPGRLRAAYKDGQIILLSSMFDASTDSGQNSGEPDTVLGQWASSSLGASFDLVGYSSRDGDHRVGFDVAVSGANFVVCWAEGTNGNPKIARISTAYELATSATTSTIGYPDAVNMKSGSAGDLHPFSWDLSITAAPDSSLYITAVNHAKLADVNTRGAAVIVASYDRGKTWSRVAGAWDNKKRSIGANATGYLHLTNMWLDGDNSDNNHYRDQLREVVGTWQRGRLVLFVRGEQTDGSAQSGNDYALGLPDKAIHALYVGGYTNLTMGSINTSPNLADRSNFAKHWIPLFKPDQYGIGWTTTQSGANSDSILANAAEEPYLKLTSGTPGISAAGNRFYADATLDNDAVRTSTTGTSGSKTHAEFCVDVVAGGSSSTKEIAVELRNGNPNKAERVSLRFSRTGTSANLAIYDEVASSQLALKKLSDLGVGLPADIRVSIHNRTIAVYGRTYDANENGRFFKLLFESGADALALETVAGKYCEITFGHIDSGGATTQNESHWYKVQAGSHDGDSSDSAVPRLNDWHGYTTPQSVGGRFFSPAPLYVEHGVNIATKDGPAGKGEEWKIETRYDFPIESLHHELQPSPGKPWRSKNDTDSEVLTWNIDTGAPALPLGTSFGMYLGNINWRFGTLEAYNGSAWVTVANIDTATQCAFIRHGNTFAPDASDTAADNKSPHFLTYQSLNGCTFNALHGGNATPKPFTITDNSEGVFSSVETRRAKVIVAGDTSAAATSGTGAIWSKNVTVIFHGDEDERYSKVRLTIPATGTANVPNRTAAGYKQIGIAVWGHVAFFGRQYSRGHIRQIDTNAELFTNKGGKRRAVRYGPARRSVEFSWSDPMDVSQMQQETPAPDWVKGYNNAAGGVVATVADAPWLLHGLIDALDGPVVPVVYLPSVATNAESAQILDPNRMLFGRVVSRSVRIENETGSEWLGDNLGEVVTATALRIDEEL